MVCVNLSNLIVRSMSPVTCDNCWIQYFRDKTISISIYESKSDVRKEPNFESSFGKEKMGSSVKSDAHLSGVLEKTNFNIAYDKVSGAIADSVPCEERKYVVYRCYKVCGGLGDREKGIVSAYLLALLTNRTLVIDMFSPCRLETSIVPNNVNWLKCKSYALNVPGNSKRLVSVTDRSKTYTVEQFVSLKEKVITIEINWFVTHHLQRYVTSNKINHMQWLVNVRNEVIIHKVLNELFRPTEHIMSEINNFITKYASNKQLVCTHVRMGKNPSIPNDVDFRRIANRGIPNVTTVLSFLKTYSNAKDYTVYVATDADMVRKEALSTIANSVSLNKEIVHIDRINHGKVSGCAGLGDAVTEQVLLSKCDVLLLTRSGFGIMAALWRGQIGQLYLHNSLSNDIQRADVNEILDFYPIK